MADQTTLDILLLYVGEHTRGDHVLSQMRASHQGATSQSQTPLSPASSKTTFGILPPPVSPPRDESIIENKFNAGRVVYRILDISRQKGDRRKFLHFFESIPAILFLVPLAEYDQPVEDDELENLDFDHSRNQSPTSVKPSCQLSESLDLLQTVCDSEWFANTDIILLMTETDVFREKVETSPLLPWFPDYTGRSIEDACNYLLSRCVSLNQRKNQEIYAHFTSRDDTRQFEFVRNAMEDILIKKRRFSH
ncbi:G-protein alpha subunit-domain-containing protein [Flagelloscypha sp. PMI_526]|nr:G-protein alpha subunit-domain-containing protein [Flagelloscypha sp. PMI_526]